MSARTMGYSFIAMRAPSGRTHLVFSEHFEEFSHPPPAGRTICGTQSQPNWRDVGAKSWYTGAFNCVHCASKIGPYATVKL